jgi:hypothetical protein
MATKLIRKTVTYRKAHFHNTDGTRTLEQLLSSASTKAAIIHDRREPTDSSGTEIRFISDWGTLSKRGFFGRLSIVQKDKSPASLLSDSTQKTIPINKFKPPLGHDYAPGILNFLVQKNHVVMTQSSLLRSSSLETHLAWLLREPTKLLQPDQGLALSDEPQKATKDRIRRSHVKSVLFGRPLLENSPETTKSGTIRSVFRADPAAGSVMSMLKSFVTGEDYEKLGLRDGIFESNLEVWIEIRYPKHSRSQSQKSMRLLDDLSIALRDVDQDEVKLTLSDGSVVTGKELKVSGHIDVSTDADGEMIEEELYAEMANCLLNWIKNGTVSPS